MTLIVNPLASVERMEETGDLYTGGPVPGRGMNYLRISPAEHPHLHELMSELVTVGLPNLDIAADLVNGERELLEEHGVLIEKDNVAQRPLFSCMLGDVERPDLVPESLVVNPTFEFQPFDLTLFRPWIQERHLSPHNATVWLVDPRTKVRWGYWLTNDEAEAIGKLEPGCPPPPDLPAEMAGRLFAADILIPSNTEVDPDLELAAAQFARDRYAVIDGVFPPAQLRALQRYYRQYVEQGFMKFGDSQVNRRFVEHGESVASMIQDAILPVMEAIVKTPIRRTYAYTAVYEEGAVLEPHVDRDACEYSFSFQLEYMPATADGVSPWPLYISVNEPDDLNVDPARDRAVNLANGAFLAYKGRELVHYRTPLPEGHRSSSIFFHYVPA